MSFTDQKREEIKKYILRKISMDEENVITKTMDNFGISITSVKRYVQEMLEQNVVMISAECKCGYKLIEDTYSVRIELDRLFVGEDQIFAEHIGRNLTNCNDAAFRIWQYTCEEMINNAIEHSRGKNIYIEVCRNVLFSRVIIMDDGVGVFRTLCDYMGEHGWKEPRNEDALVELYKGKITSNAACHSGEGIFFSSKMVDEYAIWSDAKIYYGGYGKDVGTVQSHLLAYASRIGGVGTVVSMKLENETSRKITEVFDMYTNIDGGFVKTRIPVKEACIQGEPVARSQARRICQRLEEFKEVILDFSDVEFMGQGFADEVFRVYALAHPQVVLCPVNMAPTVERMVHHVGRGKLADNVRIESHE